MPAWMGKKEREGKEIERAYFPNKGIMFRLVSHYWNKSFPPGKLYFPTWETFVSPMGNCTPSIYILCLPSICLSSAASFGKLSAICRCACSWYACHLQRLLLPQSSRIPHSGHRDLPVRACPASCPLMLQTDMQICPYNDFLWDSSALVFCFLLLLPDNYTNA